MAIGSSGAVEAWLTMDYGPTLALTCEVGDDGSNFAYKGIAVAGFPNLFMLYGPNTNAGSILEMLELQADYIVQRLGWLEDRGLASLEVRAEAMAAYNEVLQRDITAVAPWRTVGSRYFRAPSGRIVTQWPGNVDRFAATLAAPDEDAYAAQAHQQREIA